MGSYRQFEWLELKIDLVFEKSVSREDKDITFDRISLGVDLDSGNNEGVVVVGNAEVVHFLADIGILFQEGAAEKWYGANGHDYVVAIDHFDVFAQELIEFQTRDIGLGPLQFVVDVVFWHLKNNCWKLFKDEGVFDCGTFGA